MSYFPEIIIILLVGFGLLYLRMIMRKKYLTIVINSRLINQKNMFPVTLHKTDNPTAQGAIIALGADQQAAPAKDVVATPSVDGAIKVDIDATDPENIKAAYSFVGAGAGLIHWTGNDIDGNPLPPFDQPFTCEENEAKTWDVNEVK